MKNSLDLSLAEVSRWRAFFLEDPINPGLRQTLPHYLKKIAQGQHGKCSNQKLGVRRDTFRHQFAQQRANTAACQVLPIDWRAGRRLKLLALGATIKNLSSREELVAEL